MSVLVNTCLGPVFESSDLKNWIQNGQHFCIMDRATHDPYKEEFRDVERVFIADEVAGKTYESRVRLGHQVLVQIKDFLASYSF